MNLKEKLENKKEQVNVNESIVTGYDLIEGNPFASVGKIRDAMRVAARQKAIAKKLFRRKDFFGKVGHIAGKVGDTVKGGAENLGLIKKKWFGRGYKTTGLGKAAIATGVGLGSAALQKKLQDTQQQAQAQNQPQAESVCGYEVAQPLNEATRRTKGALIGAGVGSLLLKDAPLNKSKILKVTLGRTGGAGLGALAGYGIARGTETPEMRKADLEKNLKIAQAEGRGKDVEKFKQKLVLHAIEHPELHNPKKKIKESYDLNKSDLNEKEDTLSHSIQSGRNIKKMLTPSLASKVMKRLGEPVIKKDNKIHLGVGDALAARLGYRVGKNIVKDPEETGTGVLAGYLGTKDTEEKRKAIRQALKKTKKITKSEK